MSTAGLRGTELAVLLVATAALGACGEDDDSDPGVTPDAESSAPSSATTSPTIGGDRVARGWELVSADGRNLTIRVDTRECEAEPNLNTTELGRSVQIEAYAYVVGEDCDQAPRRQWEKVAVALREPLGDRDLVGCEPTDGSVDCSTGSIRTEPAATAESQP